MKKALDRWYDWLRLTIYCKCLAIANKFKRMINDPKEREHYTLKCCCANCKHKLRESPIWPFTLPFCEIKRKNLGGDLHYDHKCKSFVAVMTPEENKEWYLRFKKTLKR